MKRRSFLQTLGGGVLGAGMAAGDALSASQGIVSGRAQPSLSIRTAVKYHMVETDGSIREKFQLVKDLGYDGIELSSPNDLDNDEVLRARDEVGLPIHGVVNSVHWDKPFSHPDPEVRAEGLEAMRTALDDADAYGADTVLLVPAVVDETMPYDKAYHRSQRAIRKVLPQAERYRITVAIENVSNNFLLSPLEFAQYIDEFESPWIGAYFDIGNILRYGWPQQWIRILGHRIVKLDVKDRIFGTGKSPRIGEGDCDWKAVREALLSIDYTGWATAEVPGGDRERLQDIKTRMDRVFQL